MGVLNASNSVHPLPPDSLSQSLSQSLSPHRPKKQKQRSKPSPVRASKSLSKAEMLRIQALQVFELHKALLERRLIFQNPEFQMQMWLQAYSGRVRAKRLLKGLLCCLADKIPSLQTYEQTQVNLRIETLTCNKLSHCLFDFDCHDFGEYDKETYEHQMF